jgi:hypothetical protein
MRCLYIVNKRLTNELHNLLPFTRSYCIMPFSKVSGITKEYVPGAYLYQRTWSTEALYQWDSTTDEVARPRVQSRSSPTLLSRPIPAPISSSKQEQNHKSTRVHRMLQWVQKRGNLEKTEENKDGPYWPSFTFERAISIQHEQRSGKPGHLIHKAHLTYDLPSSDSESDRSMVLVTTSPPPRAPFIFKWRKERPTGTKNRAKDADDAQGSSDKSSSPSGSTSSHGFEGTDPEELRVKQGSYWSKKDVGGRYNGPQVYKAEITHSSMLGQVPSSSLGRTSAPLTGLSAEGALIHPPQSAYAAHNLPQLIAMSTSYAQPQLNPLLPSPGSRHESRTMLPTELHRNDSPPRRFLSSPPPLSPRTLSIDLRSSIVDFDRSRFPHRPFQHVNASLETLDVVAPSLPGMASPTAGAWHRLGDYEESLLGSLPSRSSRSTIKQSQRRESWDWV